jgi:hypothetical protein
MVSPGLAQRKELPLLFGEEVLGPLQVAVQEVHAVVEGLEADPLPDPTSFTAASRC